MLGLIAGGENGPSQYCTACVKHHRHCDCLGYIAVLSSLWKQKWTAEHIRKKNCVLGTKWSASMLIPSLKNWLTWTLQTSVEERLSEKYRNRGMTNKMWCLAPEEIWTAFFKEKSLFSELWENNSMGIAGKKKASEMGLFHLQCNYFNAQLWETRCQILLLVPTHILLELRGGRIWVTGPTCSLMMVKIKNTSSADGQTLKSSAENWTGTLALFQSLFTHYSHWF